MPESHEITRPYPGLRPFESWEGEIFSVATTIPRLLDILQQQHFLAVIGPSGSGKSSLVRAGLLPALPLGSLGTGSDWRIALLRPGNRPMQRLAHALLGHLALGIELVGEERIPQDERHLTADVALIEAELRRGPLGLIEVVKDARTRQTGEEPFNLLVLVDQFEEIFTYADAGGRQADESEAFVDLLLASRTAPEARIYIALTMRTDFLGNCVRFLELPDAINRAQYLTPRLTREQIEQAITGPAHLFEGDVEPTLVAELINAVSNDPDHLPILQHALARMWDAPRRRTAVELSRHTGMDGRYPEDRDVTLNGTPNAWVPAFPAGTTGTNRIGWNDFNAVGGIADALSSHANEILASLSPKKESEEPLSPEQRAAEVLFRAITGQRSAEAGGQAVRRPQSLHQIANWSGRSWQDFLPVVRAFAHADVNFLNYVGELTEETVVDISHEALIRQWERLRAWVAQEARLAGEYRRLRDRAEDWKNAELREKGSGALLTGSDLVRAVEWRNTEKPTDAWAKRYGAKGKETEAFEGAIAFLEESARNWDKEQASQERRRRVTFFSVCAVMIGALAAASYVGWLWQSAEAEQNKAVALKLVAEGQLAENRHSNQLQLHALLAIESMKRFPSPLANQSVRHALELMPRPLATMLHQGAVSAVSFSPNGKTLASGSWDKTVRLWDRATGKELQRLSQDSYVNAVSFSHDGKTLASGSWDKTLRVWDLATGKELQRLSHDSYVKAVSFSPDSKTLASGSGANVRVWDLATGKALRRLSHDSYVKAVSFSPDGKTLATGSADNTARVWDLATGKELHRWPHEAAVNAVSFSPDGKTLATGSGDNTARVWDLATGKELQRLSHENTVNTVSFSTDGKTLASGSGANVRVWDLAPGKELQRLSHDSDVYDVSFSPDGKTLASGSRDNTVRVWDLATGKELHRWSHEDNVIDISFSPDGKTLASGSQDNTVRVWDLATGKELQRLSHDFYVVSVSFSPDGKTLASGSWDTVRLSDVATGKELQRLSHGDWVNAIRFSPDGKTLASGSQDNTVRVWDLATGKELHRWSQEARVTDVSFSPDGKTLATGSADNTARVWDLATGKELHRWSHEAAVNAVSFSPDGKILASGSRDNTVRLWLWQPEDLMVAACERSTRNLRWDEWTLYFEDLAYGKTCAHLPVHESVIGHSQQLAKAGNVAEATALFQRISDIEPSATLDQIAEADGWERKGKREKIWASADKLRAEKQYAEWIEMAGEAMQLDPTAVPNKDWKEVCWDGALAGQALAVMRACDRAVELVRAVELAADRIYDFRGTRGLARALTGNTQGAIEDFEFFIEHTGDAEQKWQRQAWVGALKAGKNPFTPEVLQSLRGQ